jgi:hypothetical protein
MEDKKTIIMIDDSKDFGKEPLPLDNPEAKKIHDELLKKYGTKK